MHWAFCMMFSHQNSMFSFFLFFHFRWNRRNAIKWNGIQCDAIAIANRERLAVLNRFNSHPPHCYPWVLKLWYILRIKTKHVHNKTKKGKKKMPIFSIPHDPALACKMREMPKTNQRLNEIQCSNVRMFMYNTDNNGLENSNKIIRCIGDSVEIPFEYFKPKGSISKAFYFYIQMW